MIGKRLGSYEIIEELGRGGMATVYRAFHPQMERYVAVKVIHQAVAQGDEGIERFRQEARLIARLEHPHLLPVYDYSPEHDPPFIVMRYLEGGTVKEVIEQHDVIPLNEVAYIMRQIGSALDYAHRNDVIHRDIKPSNIMVDEDGNAYLADFGIARIMGEVGMTQTGFAIGTPGYMSPEQGMGVSDITAQTDIYALGVMAFEMATGQSPYRGDTPMAVLMRHIQEPVPSALAINPELPEEFDDVISKAMAKEPSDRYESAGEFARELTALVRRDEINAAPKKIKTVAIRAIKEMQEDRDTSQIDRLMEQFAGTRSEGMRAVTLQDDIATTLEPTQEKPSSADTQSSSKMPYIIAGIVILATIIGGSALFFSTQNQESDNALSTEAQIAFNLTETASVTEEITVDEPTDTDTPDDTATTVDETEESIAVADAPTSTNTATVTRTPSITPSPTNTATPSIPLLRTLRQLDARIGPSDDFAVVLTLGQGEEVEILSISSDSRWYEVLLPTGSTGWVPRSFAFVEVFGPQDSVSVSDGPTRTPTATATQNRTATAIAIASTRDANTTEQAIFDITETANAIINATAEANSTATAQANDLATENAISTVTESAIQTATTSANETATADAINAQLTADANETATQLAVSTATAQAEVAQQDNIIASQTAIANNVVATVTQQAINAQATQVAAIPVNTPVPPGRLPFVMDFEDGNDSLLGSDYEPDIWQVVSESGQSVLVGSGRLSNPFVILGSPEDGSPEWLEENTDDFLISFRMRTEAPSGVRLIFRYQPGVGYNAIEFTSGRIFVRRSRSGDSNPLTDRDTEIFVGSGGGYSANIQTDQWHDLRVWVEDRRLFVYVDNQLVIDVEDTNTPQLNVGQILLQTQNPSRSVRLDDIVIQRAEVASNHFEGGSFPSSWERSDSSRVYTATEGDNQFIEMLPSATTNPVMSPLRDFELQCRIYSLEGGYTLYLRETDAGGALRLTMEAGQMTLDIVDATDSVLFSQRVSNFYTRNIWQDLHVFYVDNRLEISLDGDVEFEDTLNIELPAGRIRFETDNNDRLRFDDCLITQSASTTDVGANFAYELIDQTSARLFRDLRSDILEDFSDIFRTDVWWVEGTSASGTFVTDPTASDNQNYLNMTSSSQSEFRLFREDVGIEIFRNGTDFNNFADSTDIWVSVDIRLAENQTSEAFVGVRTTESLTGSNINGYFLRLQRNADNTYTIVVDYRSQTGVNTTFYEADVESMSSDWFNVQIVTFEDQLAFFVDDQFITYVDNTEQIGGTMALGVGANSTADFDTLIIRDTTPHDQ